MDKRQRIIEWSRRIIILILLICYILSVLLDYGISFNECKHNPNFYEEEMQKGFADVCKGQYHGHWYLYFMVFGEPILGLLLVYFTFDKYMINYVFSAIVFVLVFKTISHIVGGYSWVLQ